MKDFLVINASEVKKKVIKPDLKVSKYTSYQCTVISKIKFYFFLLNNLLKNGLKKTSVHFLA